jgi:hypothetical protein
MAIRLIFRVFTHSAIANAQLSQSLNLAFLVDQTGTSMLGTHEAAGSDQIALA